MNNENDNVNQGLTTSNNSGDQNNQNSTTQAGKDNQANVDANKLEFGEEIRKLLSTAGSLKLNDIEMAAMYAKIEDDEIYIKPDGTVYLSWPKYAGRLTKAVTGIGWAMIPQGMPKLYNNLIVWGFHLIIKGVYCGFAIGEQTFHANNNRMTYGEACEGAKSNALTRLCKGIGIGTELWDKQFSDWLKKYAEKKWDPNANGGQGANKWALKANAFGTENISTESNLDSKTTKTPPPPPADTRKDNRPAAINTAAPVANTVIAPVAEVKNDAVTSSEETEKNDAKTDASAKKTPVSSKSGKGKSKMAENTDFLNDKKGGKKEAKKDDTTKENPEKEPVDSLFTSYFKQLDKVKTATDLRKLYDEKIKASWTAGEITESEKEELREKANKLHKELSAKK